MDVNAYLSVFIDEAKEHLQAITDSLLKLERKPEQLEAVQQIFRSAHTLKGMAATMEFDDLAALTHEMENVFDLIRNEKLMLDRHIFDVLFQSLDDLEKMVEDIVEGGSGKADVTSTVAKLKQVANRDQIQEVDESTSEHGSNNLPKVQLDLYQETLVKQALDANYEVSVIYIQLEESCVMKAVRAYMTIETLSEYGEIFLTNPSVEEMEQEWSGTSFQIGFITSLQQEKWEDAIASISEVKSVQVHQWLQANEESAATVAAELKLNHEEISQKEAKRNMLRTSKKQGNIFSAARTIRVDIDRLDHVINLFSELLIDRTRLEALALQINHPELTETVEQMSRISSELQDTVLNLRMVPVESVFNRFPRMVRDLARNLDKDVELIITGEDTELDRTVIEEIGDPLVHLLRNAVDHGIELPAERQQRNKPATGTVHLRAFHSGNHVMIEIEEDGKGIHRDSILKTAIKNGVISEEQADGMANHEVHQLLFASGFSTAKEVSDISGRGVGLDVVRSKIESLGGEVSVYSEWGTGTKFSIRLPLTLSIIAAMLFRLGDEDYALPLSSIQETMSYPAEKVKDVHGTAMIAYEKGLIPLVPLKKLFECTGPGRANEDELLLIIVQKGDRFAAIEVDEIYGQQEIVLKPLGSYLTHLFAVSGATILGDGQVALIVDSNALMK